MHSPNKSNKNSKYSSVFISYSRKDKEFVEKLVDKLREHGVEVWLDDEKLGLGEWFTNKIGEAIDKSDFFAVVLSQNALDSKYVEKEIEIALNRDIDKGEVVVLPLLIEENIALPPFLRGKNYVSFTLPENFEKSFQKLLNALKKKEDEEPDSGKFYPNKFIPDLKFFVGRTQLLEDLQTQLSSTHRASIHDISGLGKTFTTYKFADLHQNKYDKIFFVRANKEEMTQSLAEIAVLLDDSLKNEPDQSKQAQGFKNWLEENENWLVIYDNVDEPLKLFPYVPLNKNGDCIFTSNFALITRLGDEIKIEKLDKADAESLLFSRANNKPHSELKFEDAAEQKAFENIVKEIDGLPVSLNTTGAFINKNTISFAEFERKMQRTPEILVKNEDGFDNYQNKSALKAFSIAIEDISEKKDEDEFKDSAELAQKLLFAVGFIAPDNIPEILLQKILREITEIDFESEENEDLWIEIRKKLLEYDLLKYRNNIFRTHRLIQKVIQLKSPVDEQKIIIFVVLRAIDSLFPWSIYGNWEECDLYLPHSVSVVKFAEDLNLSSEEIAINYDKIGRHFRGRVQYQSAIEYLNKAIDKYQASSLSKNTNLAACLNELSIVFYSQGMYDESIELRLRCIEINKQVFGEMHLRIAIDYSSLSVVYNLQGKYEEAMKFGTQSLAISEKTNGKEHFEHAVCLNNLANILQSQGRYDEAKKLYKESLVILNKNIGKEHPLYATTLSNLAVVYRLQENYDEAIEIYKEALVICEKTVGKEHPEYATRLNNLASVYEKQEKCKEALGLYKESLRIFEKTLPENHPYILQLRKSVARGQIKLKLK